MHPEATARQPRAHCALRAVLLVLLLTLLTACGGNGATGDDEAPGTAAPEPAEPAGEPTTAAGEATTAVTATTADATAEPPAELQPVAVADQGALTNLPVNVADAQGFLAEEGLTLERVQIAAFGEVVAALINGDVDVTVHTPLVIATLNQGDSGRSVSYFVNVQAPDINLVAASGLGVEPATETDWEGAVQAMRGHTLGVPALEGIFDLIPQSLMRDAGVDPQAEVTIIATGAGPAALAALENDQVQFLVADSLAATTAEVRGTGDTVLALGAGQGPEDVADTMWVGAIALRERLEVEPELFAGFARAVERATEYLSDPANRDGMVAILQEYHGVDAEVAEGPGRQPRLLRGVPRDP